MKILGINISHHPSICILENGKITDFYNEERFVVEKDYELGEDNFEIVQAIQQRINFTPDVVTYASYGRFHRVYEDLNIINKIQNQLRKKDYFFDYRKHHIYHALCGFYFSQFNEAVAIVVDGGGACIDRIPYREVESLFFVDSKNVYSFYRHVSSGLETDYLNVKEKSSNSFLNGVLTKISNIKTGGMLFSDGCIKIGMRGGEDAGKLMGLSSYAYCDEKYDLDYNKVNIAKEVQEKNFNETCELIEMAKTKSKNIILSGGCALNCSNNFKYVKKYPDLNFFIDPVPYDAGTAIGVALYYEHYKR